MQNRGGAFLSRVRISKKGGLADDSASAVRGAPQAELQCRCHDMDNVDLHTSDTGFRNDIDEHRI